MDVEVRVIREDEWDVFSEVFGTALGFTLPEETRPYWRAILDDDRIFGAFTGGDHMVATAADFATELTLPGGATVPAAAVTAVGTLPTHRRRGAAAGLMRHQLRTAREAGHAAAVLHASEATIYERFGYGAAAPVTGRVIETAHASLRPRPDAGGHVAFVLGDDRRDVLTAVHDRARRDTPGEIARTEALWARRLFQAKEDDKKLYVAHVDADGNPDGYLAYRFKGGWEGALPNGEVDVYDCAALSPEAHLALWEWVLGIDLARRVRTNMLPDDDPVLFALADPRRMRTEWQVEGLYLRPLDVERLLRERTWMGDGELTIAVHDDLFADQSGTYRVTQDGDEVTVERGDGEADVAMGVAELGAVILGATPIVGLALAGRVTARSYDALHTAARLFAADRIATIRTDF